MKEESIVLKDKNEVGFLKKRRNYIALARAVAILAVIVLTVALALGGVLGRSRKNGGGSETEDRFELGGNMPEGSGSAFGTDSEADGFENTESESKSESETEESGEDNVEDTVAVSADLSRSEMGDCFAYNYTDELIDFEGLLTARFSGARYSFTEEPLVMIIHTYSNLGYSDHLEGDVLSIAERSVVAVGEVMADRLNGKGISTVHVTVIHDGADAYAETRRTIETMLEIYPTIEYVIDLGRFDARDESGRQIRTASREGCAQIRLTVSTCGQGWKDDLALALKLRKGLNDEGKGICLPVTVSESPYNSGESLYYLKTDIGTAANSSHEAFYAVEYFADAFESIIKIGGRG